MELWMSGRFVLLSACKDASEFIGLCLESVTSCPSRRAWSSTSGAASARAPSGKKLAFTRLTERRLSSCGVSVGPGPSS